MLYFEISMENFEVVQFLESPEGMDNDLPDPVLSEVLLFLLGICNFVIEIAIVSELHNYTEENGWYHKLLPSRKAYL